MMKSTKRLLLIYILIVLAIVTSMSDQAAAKAGTQISVEETYAGDLLCIPDVYILEPQDCLALGPSEHLTELARIGITVPPPPFPATRTPIGLAEIPYQYIKIMQIGDVPVHTSVQDAINKNTRRFIQGGFRYLSYSVREELPEGIFYFFKTGEWIEGSYVSRVSPPVFQGYELRETPRLPFGWILDGTNTRYSPGYSGEESDHPVVRFDFVYVYDTAQVDGTDWYMIDANEWVEKKFISVVTPDVTPPQGVDNNRWTELDLYQQTLTVYDQGEMVFATLMSSGLDPFFTKPGLFQIFQKLPTETMSSGNPSDYYYLEDVPWTMYFDESRALHGAYWHSFFGYPRSHGCVNLSIADSHWLFDWAREGDWVYVWDPSGQTPTDPSFYTSGGP